MPAVNQYKPFAFSGTANVEDPATWAADPVRNDGFEVGVADPAQANTALRQATVMAAALAQAVADTLVVLVPDDGNVAALEAQLLAMFNAVAIAAVNAAGSFGSGGIFGMITANTPGHLTTWVTVGAGQCRNSLNDTNIVLPAPISKDITAAWAAGTGAGGRTSGALANGQTLFVFVCYNPGTTAVDAFVHTSPTAPTVPAGFTKFRRVGAIILEAASTLIRQYVQTGDYFMFTTRSADYAAQANGGAASLRLITTPLGIKVRAIFYFQSQGTASSVAFLSGVFDPDFGVPAAFGGATQWAQVRRTGALDPSSSPYCYGTGVIQQFTDIGSHVYTFSSDASDVIALGVLGWVDDRGRFF